MARLCRTLLLTAVAATQAIVCLRAEDPAEKPPAPPSKSSTRRALIIVGLEGDEEHRQLFGRIASAWETWLVDGLQFSPENVMVLSGREPSPVKERPQANRGPATRTSIAAHAEALAEQSKPQDAAWVFLLGHAHYDEEHAHFHLPGPDFDERDLPAMFDGLKCGEQVFWLTHTCSGWFLQPLSRRGRIVITASAADREFNETEFPLALEAVAQKSKEHLDINKDQRVSVGELFVTTVKNVNALFAADQRLPTEHALLDDNGDGEGTEADELQPDSPEDRPSGLRRVKRPDGQLAFATLVHLDAPAAEAQPDRTAPDDGKVDDATSDMPPSN